MNIWIIVIFMASGMQITIPYTEYTDEDTCKVFAAHVAKQYDVLGRINPEHPDQMVGAYCEPRLRNATGHRT